MLLHLIKVKMVLKNTKQGSGKLCILGYPPFPMLLLGLQKNYDYLSIRNGYLRTNGTCLIIAEFCRTK